MNKQDEDKAREVAVKWRAKGLPYNAIYDSTLEMAAWKEQQMIEKACEYLRRNYPYVFSVYNIEQFKNYMKNEM